MWIPLSEIDPKRSERFGHKAIRLISPLKRGLPLPASWVLSCPQLARIGEEAERATLAARELLELAPKIEKFLLRSSSPLEDRVDASAAGLFQSIPSDADEESLAHALREMADSARHPHLAGLLRTPAEAVTLAVLAQEHLALRIWATVECELRAGKERRMRVEGRVHSAEGPLPFDFEFSFASAAAEFQQALSEKDAELQTYHESIAAVLSLAQRAVEEEEGIWLLELGTSAQGPMLLQRRPVGQRSPFRRPAPRRGTAPREDPPFYDFPLFASDTRTQWEHDAEHSPRPLCPLLAGNFVEWIRKKGEKYPARVIHGRWYEAAAREQKEQVEDATRAEASLRKALRDWNERRLPELERGLQELAARYSPLSSPSFWPEFLRTWLAWQDRYFDGSAFSLRRLAAALSEELERWGRSLPPLPSTIADRRARELDRLAARFEKMDEEERERALESFLARHGHVAPGPSDGRSVPWQEDPAPLVAELKRRADAMAAGERADPQKAPHESRGGEPNSAAELAARAFANLEDDDDLLARAYALFRGCALDLQAWLEPEAESAEILELLPDDLEELLGCAPSERAEHFMRALARGKTLMARWESEFSREHPPETERIQRGSILPGKALAEGRASGELCILPSAQSAGGPPPGAVLVVPSVLPADAIVFSRCAALICESGAVLGHAAVLAREKKIPALVLPGACTSLAQVTRVRVDGSRGEVEVLSLREEGTSR